MKKAIVLIATLITVACSYAQKKDSTSKKQVTNNPNAAPQQYFVIGTDAAFKLLEKGVAYPDDVTANEKRELLQWIQKRNQLVSDTAQKKDH